MMMELFYKRNKGKIVFTLVLFVMAVIALVVNRMMESIYSEVSLQADVSFWIAAFLLLMTIAMGIYLLTLEYTQLRKR